jgi:hypothetical protein
MSVIRDLLADAASEGLITTVPMVRIRYPRTGQGRTPHPGLAVDPATILAVCDRLPVLAENLVHAGRRPVELRLLCRPRDDRRLCVCGSCSFWLCVCLRG